MHTGLGEALVGCICFSGVIYHPWNDYRRCAILQQVNFPDKSLIMGAGCSQQITHGPGHTMTLGFTRYDDSIKIDQFLKEFLILLGDLIALGVIQHFRPDRRIAFG